jgi:hypothetical protein
MRAGYVLLVLRLSEDLPGQFIQRSCNRKQIHCFRNRHGGINLAKLSAELMRILCKIVSTIDQKVEHRVESGFVGHLMPLNSSPSTARTEAAGWGSGWRTSAEHLLPLTAGAWCPISGRKNGPPAVSGCPWGLRYDRGVHKVAGPCAADV